MIKRAMARKMVEVYKAAGGNTAACSVVRECFKNGDFSHDDVSIRMLAEETLGRDWCENTRANAGGGLILTQENIGLGGAVDSTGFSSLLATIIAGLMDAEPAEADVGLAESLVTTKRVTRERGERLVNLKKVGREAVDIVQEGGEYSAYGFGSDFVDMPDTVKRGGYVLLTKEMIAEDETGKALDAARSIINENRMQKAERILKTVLGIDNAVYAPLGVIEGSYVSSGAGLDNPGRVNLVTSGAELLDWTDLDEAFLRWADMTDKVTGRPVSVNPDTMQLIVMPHKWARARQILGAAGIDTREAAAAVQGEMRGGPNPYAGFVSQVTSSMLAYSLLTRAATDSFNPGGGVSAANAKNYWYLGDFKKAFEYREQWPLTVETIGADTLLGFTRDVVFGVKVSEKGVMAVKDPRQVQQMRQA
jgi:hypothetical protein